MARIEKIVLDGGKYTVLREGGDISALRYGQAWRDTVGDNLVGAMFDRILELEAKLSAVAQVMGGCI